MELNGLFRLKHFYVHMAWKSWAFLPSFIPKLKDLPKLLSSSHERAEREPHIGAVG